MICDVCAVGVRGLEKRPTIFTPKEAASKAAPQPSWVLPYG